MNAPPSPSRHPKSPLLPSRKHQLSPKISQFSHIRSSEGSNSPFGRSQQVSPRHYKNAFSDSEQAKAIFKQVKTGIKDPKRQLGTSLVKWTPQERQILTLSHSLQKFSHDHKLREQKQQIHYVNTLQRIKNKSKKFGLHIRAKTQGIQLRMTQQQQTKDKDLFNYTFGKQFDRFLKQKFVQSTKKVSQNTFALNLSLSQNGQSIQDSLKKNDNLQDYKKYDFNRMQAYMKAKATNKGQYPYYIKKQLQSKFAKLTSRKEQENLQKTQSPLMSPNDSKRNTGSKEFKINLQECASERSQGSPASTFRIEQWPQYAEDISQFVEIADFFSKIQTQLTRYLPNNHLLHKITNLMKQVEHGDIILKLFNRCKKGKQTISFSEIVKILKKCPGILGTMNYLVNVIKLNISAERRKRVKDIEKNISNYQLVVKQRHREVCEKLKYMPDSGLKNNIFQSIKNTKFECLAMKTFHKQFSDKIEKEEFSDMYSRNTICQILKYETLMK